jgi:hypothetical protein
VIAGNCEAGERYEGAKAVFRAAREEFDGGYSESLEAEVSSEVFGNFVALAKAARSSKRS